MIHKKMLAVMLCAAVLISALCGCVADSGALPDGGAPDGAGQESAGLEDAAQAAADPTPDAENPGAFYKVDFAAAFAAFSPDTAMIVVDDHTVTWAELFFLLREDLKTQLDGLYSFPDLTQSRAGGESYAEMVMKNAVGRALKFRAFEYGVKLTGFTLDESQTSYLEYLVKDMLDSVGDDARFMALLWENNGIRDLDLFKYLLYQDYLPYFIFVDVYGNSGEKLSDEEAARETEGEGYMVAKHIMRMKDPSGDSAPLGTIEDILFQLQSYDGDDFASFFDELIYEYSDDGGGAYDFPDGYLFRPGDMEPAFAQACMLLEIGEFSGVVESEEGYHIIYRLPVNYDIVPIVQYGREETDSLRVIVAMALFEATAQGWKEGISPSFTSEFLSIDLSAIFVEK